MCSSTMMTVGHGKDPCVPRLGWGQNPGISEVKAAQSCIESERVPRQYVTR